MPSRGATRRAYVVYDSPVGSGTLQTVREQLQAGSRTDRNALTCLYHRSTRRSP